MAGHNKIKMTDLALLYQSIGFRDAETFIQSGNVIFSCDTTLSAIEIAERIEQAIKNKFKYDISVMLRPFSGLKNMGNVNPYPGEPDFDPAKMAVMFLREEPDNEQKKKVENVSYPPDKFSIIGSEIYIYCPNGFGGTKLYTNFFEKKMGVTGTARNWNSIVRILDIAGGK
jgi:uncharacterized protein (DUF1697 family)